MSILLNLFWKILENFLNFSANYFYKIFKILQSLICTFLLNVPPNRNFGDAFAVQYLSGIHVWNFVLCSPLEPKFLSRYWYNCTLYITVVLGQYSIWTSGKWEFSFMLLIFAVIFQNKLYSTNFIILYIDCGPGRAGNFGPVDTSNKYPFWISYAYRANTTSKIHDMVSNTVITGV